MLGKFGAYFGCLHVIRMGSGVPWRCFSCFLRIYFSLGKIH